MAQEFNPELSDLPDDNDFEAATEFAEVRREQAKENLKELVNNPKTRPKVLFTVSILVISAALAVVFVSRSGNDDIVGSASIQTPNVQADKNIKLDQTSSKHYADLDNKYRVEQAEAAKKAGGAHIDLPASEVQSIDNKDAVILPDTTAAEKYPVKPYVPQQQPQPASYNASQMAAAMQTQMQALFDGWQGQPSKVSTITYQVAQAPQSPANGGQQKPAEPTPNFIVKAGKMFYGTLDLEANSDEPGEILATIQNGPLKGSKLIGTFVANKETLTLKFTQMSAPFGNESFKISALAIDPENLKKGMATDVDHHYLERYGLLLASSFVAGIGEAATRSNSVISTSPLGSTQTQGELDTSDQLLAGLGKAGQTLSNDLSKRANIPPTIKIDAGYPVGILFMEDFKTVVPEEVAEKVAGIQ